MYLTEIWSNKFLQSKVPNCMYSIRITAMVVSSMDMLTEKNRYPKSLFRFISVNRGCPVIKIRIETMLSPEKIQSNLTNSQKWHRDKIRYAVCNQFCCSCVQLCCKHMAVFINSPRLASISNYGNVGAYSQGAKTIRIVMKFRNC